MAVSVLHQLVLLAISSISLRLTDEGKNLFSKMQKWLTGLHLGELLNFSVDRTSSTLGGVAPGILLRIVTLKQN